MFKKYSYLGPGIVYAAAAIGVSHLVQSTRAGALYGLSFIPILILVNLLKLPFFEFGPRYAQATGKSLLEGYKKIGNWALASFGVITLTTIFIVLAAVTSVCAGILSNIWGSSISFANTHLLILLVCASILLFGKFKLLSQISKIGMLILTICTFFAVILATFKLGLPNYEAKTFNWSSASIIFLISFAGWMPTPIDASVWHSIWALEKAKVQQINAKQSKTDFYVGYIGTMLIAIFFLLLGTLLWITNSEPIPEGAVAFTGKIMSLFTSILGNWTYPIIAVSVLITMFSTVLTVLDAYPKVFVKTTTLLLNKPLNETRFTQVSIIVLVIGAQIISNYSGGSMLKLIDFATAISFVTAPLLASYNYYLVTNGSFPSAFHPPKKLKLLAIVGLIFLIFFSFAYLYYLWF